MPTQNVYIAITAGFLLSYGFALSSLFMPQWVQYKSPAPVNTVVDHGLWQKCSTLTGDCRRFPQRSWGDCDHDEGRKSVNLCLEWRIADVTAVLSALVGLWVLAGLSTVFYTGERFRQQGWKHILGLIGLYAALQVATMGLIAHVKHESSMFAYGTGYGVAFILSNVSWTFGALLAASVMGYARYAGGYIALQD
ncbi:hypothetical protein DFQ27_004406 [Actinomortierella ambigua]|uniref:Uncharacterized protein n=1 Tax=Actinomortierella ambigua TaxID=1343610 RepID=A0A9P6U3G4_9FUNG|nr:hypothetical protein DFQ26_004160 [Actinomortierella ambigua]KAG0258856.1 hypothetical protein DFQ27_004406 [Actinomortierella ambigua]